MRSTQKKVRRSKPEPAILELDECFLFVCILIRSIAIISLNCAKVGDVLCLKISGIRFC